MPWPGRVPHVVGPAAGLGGVSRRRPVCQRAQPVCEREGPTRAAWPLHAFPAGTTRLGSPVQELPGEFLSGEGSPRQLRAGAASPAEPEPEPELGPGPRGQREVWLPGPLSHCRLPGTSRRGRSPPSPRGPPDLPGKGAGAARARAALAAAPAGTSPPAPGHLAPAIFLGREAVAAGDTRLLSLIHI